MRAGGSAWAFWTPVAVSLAATPVCLLLGIGSAGAGHGSYLLAKILFPLTMLSTLFLGSITGPFIVLAVIQNPAYGLISGLANKRGRLWPTLWTIFALHALLAVVCVLVPNESF